MAVWYPRASCGIAVKPIPATGLTLFPDAVLRAGARRVPRTRVYVPLDADPEAAVALVKVTPLETEPLTNIPVARSGP